MIDHKLVSIKFSRMEFSQIFQLKKKKKGTKSNTVVPVVVIGNCSANNLVAS